MNPEWAKCNPRGKTFDSAAMGKLALRSYIKSAKHSVNLNVATDNPKHV